MLGDLGIDCNKETYWRVQLSKNRLVKLECPLLKKDYFHPLLPSPMSYLPRKIVLHLRKMIKVDCIHNPQENLRRADKRIKK